METVGSAFVCPSIRIHMFLLVLYQCHGIMGQGRVRLGGRDLPVSRGTCTARQSSQVGVRARHITIRTHLKRRVPKYMYICTAECLAIHQYGPYGTNYGAVRSITYDRHVHHTPITSSITLFLDGMYVPIVQCAFPIST